MISIKYNTQDKRYIFLMGEPKEMMELEKYLNKIPQYMFLPSFRGIPKPEVFLNKFKKNDKVIYYCHHGLWKCVTDWCKENNIETSVIVFDDYKDSDEYISNKGKEAFDIAYNNRISFIDFKLNYLKSSKNMSDSVEKSKYINEAIESFNTLSSDI